MFDSSTDKSADEVINLHVGFAMAAGAIPLPIVDVVAVTAIQLDMLTKLAQIYNVPFDGERGKALVGALTGSTLGSVIGRAGASAIKGVPGIGTVLGVGSQVVLAGASTFAVGKVFQHHFKNNGNLFQFNLDELKKNFEEFFKQGEKEVQEKRKEPTTEEAVETLIKLNELYKQGVLSDEEFTKAKVELMARILR